jgi:hypothetical protein
VRYHVVDYLGGATTEDQILADFPSSNLTVETRRSLNVYHRGRRDMRRSLAVVGLVVLIGADHAPTSQRPPIAGIWRFEREVDRRADGAIVSLGPDQGYEGMVILTPDGFMSGTLMPKGRRWAVGTASLAELRETVEMGTANSGRYIVDPATQTIAINVVTSLDPADVGKRLTRHYVFDKEGALTLSGTWAYSGETYGFAITFSRMK